MVTFFNQPEQMPAPAYVYRATVRKVTDGDTVPVSIDLGFHTRADLTLRLYGIDTPERGQSGYKEASARVKSLIRPGYVVIVQTFEPPEYGTGEKWGRWLGLLWLPDGRCLNELLVAEGHAVPYFGGTKQSAQSAQSAQDAAQPSG